MSKKDEAFGLFSQGKTPDDLEVVDLGLAKTSVERYYREWKKSNEPSMVAEAPTVVPPSEVPVSSIPNGVLFEHKGQFYSKRMIHRTGRVLADGMCKTRYPNIYHRTRDAVWLPLDTLVTPK